MYEILSNYSLLNLLSPIKSSTKTLTHISFTGHFSLLQPNCYYDFLRFPLLTSLVLSRHIVVCNYATTKHSLRAALQLSPSDVQRSVTLNYSYLPVLVKLVTKYLR